MCVRGFLKYSELKEIVVIISDCLYNSDFILYFPGDDEILRRIFDREEDFEWTVILVSESEFLSSLDSLEYPKKSISSLRRIESAINPWNHTREYETLLQEESERICV
jgi:hypothetical protein